MPQPFFSCPTHYFKKKNGHFRGTWAPKLSKKTVFLLFFAVFCHFFAEIFFSGGEAARQGGEAARSGGAAARAAKPPGRRSRPGGVAAPRRRISPRNSLPPPLITIWRSTRSNLSRRGRRRIKMRPQYFFGQKKKKKKKKGYVF